MSTTKSSTSLPPFTALVAGIGKEQERLAAYSGITTTKDCIDAIPATYREALRPRFFQLSNECDRYGRINKTLQTMRTHKRLETLPPQLKSIGTPEFQYMKEFLEKERNNSEEHPIAKMNSIVAEFHKLALETVIKAKESELEFVGSRINSTEVDAELIRIIKDVYKQQTAFHVKTVDTEMGGAPSLQSMPSDPANQTANKDDWMTIDYNRAIHDVPILAKRVIEISRSRDMAELQKSLAKLEVHQKALPTQQDAAVTTQTLNEFFDKRLAEEVKKLLAKSKNKPNAPKKNGNKKKDPPKRKTKGTGKVQKKKGKK